MSFARIRGGLNSHHAAALVMVVLAVPAQSQPIVWRNITPGPTPRAGHAMVYDEARQRVVMFGGSDGTNRADTWEWDGIQWTRKYTSGPSPRSGLAMAYDSLRQRTVLYGGTNASTLMSDTWEWNGDSWELRATTGPGPRVSAAMTFDSARGRTVLFGGATPFLAAPDTWEWDGSTWTIRATAGPVRVGHAMAYDEARNCVVLFGGSDGTGQTADTWEYYGAFGVWVLRANIGPSPRGGHSILYNAGAARVELFGGDDSAGTLSDTWAWNGSAWEQLSGTAPEPSSGHASAYDSQRDRVVVFAGSGATGDTWEWDGVAWNIRAIGEPKTTSGRAVLDTNRSRVLVRSGDRWWQWTGTRWMSVPGSGAPGDEPIVYDSARDRVVLFAGTLGQTWEWDGTSWSLRSNVGPSRRTNALIAYDANRQRVVLFGGETVPPFSTWMSDTWEWDGTVWTLRASTGPVGSVAVAMAYHPAWRRVVMNYGNGELWQWNGSAWSQLPIVGTPTLATIMVYDEARGRLVARDSWDTWELGDSGWSLLTSSGPAYSAAVSYDPGRARLIQLGGGSSFGETWELACLGDANDDHQIDSADLGILLSNWQLQVPVYTGGDFDGDSVITAADLGALLSGWGGICP